MSDSAPEFSIAPFMPVEVADGTVLKAQLAVIADIEAERAIIKRLKTFTGIAAGLAVPLSGLWAVAMMWYRYYYAYNWDFLLSPLLTGVPIMVVCGVISAVAVAVVKDGRSTYDELAPWAFIGGGISAIIGLITLIGTLPFTLPFIVWAVLTIAMIYFVTWPHLGTKLVGSDRRLDVIIADNRYDDLQSFIGLQATWSDYTQLLNRLILKLEHHQIDEVLVPEVEKGLEALRASEKFVRDRLQYMHALASEGNLGTRTVRASLTDFAIHDLSGRMDDMKAQVARLREIDRKAVAALQVATGRY